MPLAESFLHCGSMYMIVGIELSISRAQPIPEPRLAVAIRNPSWQKLHGTACHPEAASIIHILGRIAAIRNKSQSIWQMVLQ
jgi:hypothetical protein